MDEIDVQALWDHRKKFKEIAAEQGTKLTFLPYVEHQFHPLMLHEVQYA
jgi:pyruvate/2-oxoglutarate dehydrogenase complex dihydrolipoamide acyltransferase (E2) component